MNLFWVAHEPYDLVIVFCTLGLTEFLFWINLMMFLFIIKEMRKKLP